MKFRLLVIAMLATAFCVTPSWAKTAKPTNYSVTLTIQQTSCTSPSIHVCGACTGGTLGLADNCYGGDDCFCCTYTGTAKGSAGDGPVTIYETNQWGIAEDDVQSAIGEIDIDGSKDVEVIYFLGSDTTPAEVFPTTALNFLNGACIITESDVFTGGYARCGGNYSDSSKTTFTIEGSALK